MRKIYFGMLLRLILIMGFGMIYFFVTKEILVIGFLVGYLFCWIFSMIHIKLFTSEKTTNKKKEYPKSKWGRSYGETSPVVENEK